ncbi:MAG: hypothetical protein R6U20_09175, partial [Longimonas sp.]|uniref:hypothetical protein n=1 Tax=Longimonas sp. TaxID=2039626 RepID=UPI003976AC42
KYINTTTQEYPLTARQIRQANPLISYPKPFNAPGYAPVTETTPDYDPLTQNATEAAPALIGDTWTQQWTITEKTEQEQADFIAALKEKHKKLAEAEQETVFEKLSKNQLKKSLGLAPELTDTDEAALKDYAKTVQADIDNPPETMAYNPPLPPGVTPPSVNSIVVTHSTTALHYRSYALDPRDVISCLWTGRSP